MSKAEIVASAFILLVFLSPASLAQEGPAENTSFFLTSAGPGDGANLGGLAGADRHCFALATEAGLESRTWRAYLSTTSRGGIDARDRIGRGPWYNYKGEMVAASVADLHSESNNLNKQTALSEKGEVINGRGDTPNRHDILTGSNPDGTALTILDADAPQVGRGRGGRGGGGRGGLPPPPPLIDRTCSNWTDNSDGGFAQVGHFDRQGGGDNPTSWNSAHTSQGCGQANLQATGGDGLFYCFAID